MNSRRLHLSSGAWRSAAGRWFLAGGGVTGIAWETGLLAGLAEAGVDLTSADVVVGTSAGSVVGAQILSGVPLEDLYAEQLKEATGEIAAKIGARAMAWFVIGSLWPGDERRGRALLGRAALRSRTVPESVRRAVIEQRLPSRSWPDRRLLITAVDAETGEARVFDRDGDVPLPLAVAASCAVPGGLAPDHDQRAPLRGWRRAIGCQRRPRSWLRSGGRPGPGGIRGPTQPANRCPARGSRHECAVDPDQP